MVFLKEMGTSAGTLSWKPNEKDAQFITKFRNWTKKESLTYDSPYENYNPGKTTFAVDSSGLWRNSTRLTNLMEKCELELRRNNVTDVKLQISELPM
jgi:hypothetical protein